MYLQASSQSVFNCCHCRFDGLRIQRQIIQAQNGMSNSNRKAAKARTSDKARLMFEAKLETVNGPATLLAFSEAISLGESSTLFSLHLVY